MRKHLTEQTGDSRSRDGEEARDRRVIRLLGRADHARRDVLTQRRSTGGEDRSPTRVAVEQQRDHHRRIVRCTTMTVTGNSNPRSRSQAMKFSPMPGLVPPTRDETRAYARQSPWEAAV
jgi:hypothetical protein